MDIKSVERAFQIIPIVEGSYWWDINNTEMTFEPHEYLTANDFGPQKYTVTISKDATDKNGTNLIAPYNFSFTTELYPGIGNISGLDFEEYLGGKPLFTNLCRINDIESNKEYVWFGTTGGLVEFDKKNNWKVFDTTNGLISNLVLSIAYHNNNLWVGTNGGVSKYSFLDNSWSTLTKNDGLDNDFINSIAADENNIWFGHGNSVSRFNLQNKKWITYKWETHYPSYDFEQRTRHSYLPDSVNDIFIDNDNIWFARRYDGIKRYSISTNNWKDFSEEEEFLSRGDLSITGDEYNIWCGGYEGISTFSKVNSTWSNLNSTNSLLKGYIVDITIDGNYLWIVYDYNGVSKYDISTGSIINYNTSNGLGNEDSSSINVDGDNIWIGHKSQKSGGVSRYKKSLDSWTIYNTKNRLFDTYVRSILIDKDTIWFGTASGLLKYSKTNQSFTKILKNGLWDDIFFIVSDNDQIWVPGSSYGYGVKRYSKTSKNWSSFEIYQWSYPVYSMAVDGDQIWFGTEEYLLLFNRKTQNWTVCLGYWDEYLWVYDIAVDEHFVWFVTHDGLWKCLKSSPNVKTQILSNDWIISVAIDGDYVWVGNDHGYIKRYSKSLDKWETITTGLESDVQGMYNFVNSIIVEDNTIWFGTDRGLIRYSKSTGDIKIFDTKAGLVSNDIQSMALDDNILWIGTYHGISRFDTQLERFLTPEGNVSTINYTENGINGLENDDKGFDIYLVYLIFGIGLGIILIFVIILKRKVKRDE
jgi:ligand-binding sensor domain-containing protein